MFSADFDVDEALERIMRCDHVMFTEQFEKGIDELNRKTGLNLIPRHNLKARRSWKMTDVERRLAREILDPEYRLLELVEAEIGSRR
jgi:hypothetical protein